MPRSDISEGGAFKRNLPRDLDGWQQDKFQTRDVFRKDGD